jgi:hypothetical protein
MKRFVQGEARTQMSLLPECLDDYVAEDNPVRVVEAFNEAIFIPGRHAAREDSGIRPARFSALRDPSHRST